MTTLLANLRDLVPSVRLRTVALGAVFAFSTLAVQAAPTELPVDRPAALSPQPVQALGCASEPTFTGYLTNTYTTTAATLSTTGLVRGYISDVLSTWSCTAYYRYDGLASQRETPTDGANYQWGTLINSTSVPCNWVVNETTYLKANGGSSCHTSDSDNGMSLVLAATGADALMERVWHADNTPDEPGDFMFVHSDCTSYYEDVSTPGQKMRWATTFSTTDTTNRPGANCDPSVIDGTGTTQSIVVDGTPPVTDFLWPNEGTGPAVVRSAFAGVNFDATDNVAGFASGANDWDLQRQKATWDGTQCGTFANDTTTGNLTSGVDNAANQTVSQSLADTTCYRWTLAATDKNGNAASTKTSGTIRTDLSMNHGQQGHQTFESWDLGAGDNLSVNVGTGNLVISHPIASLPIRGGSFDLNLTYNRHDTGSVGFGTGWRLDAFRRLTVAGNGDVTYIDGDGARHVFTGASGSPVTTYTRPDTLYADLTEDTAATPDRFTLTWRDGSVDRFDELSTNTGYLKEQVDRHGNAMAFTYDGSQQLTRIEDPTSRDVDLTWASGKVTEIKDWAYLANDGSGVVQTGTTANRRTHRFLYSGSDLRGWADPLAPTGDCTAGGSHITCFTYATGSLSIAKTQTFSYLDTAPTPDVITSSTQTATTTVAFTNADVANVKHAHEVATFGGGTAFSHPIKGGTEVVRSGTAGSSADLTTRYALVGPEDAYARIASLQRKLGSAWLTTTTAYHPTYKIEVASVTEDAGGTLDRTVTNTWSAGTIGPNLTRVVEPITTTTNRWTDHVYNANHDITETRISLDGSTTTRVITRFCYGSACNTGDAGDDLLRVIDNYVDTTAGGTDGHLEDVTVEYVYDANGQRVRETRQNYAPGGTTLDTRRTDFAYDANGNLTTEIVNYANGAVTSPGDDVTPNASTNARTDLTTVHAYDTAGNRVSTADPRRAIATAVGPSPAADDYVTRWTYDALGQRLTEKTPTTPTITITCAGTSPNCRESAWIHDEFGAVRRAVDFGNLVTATTFDRAGRATSSHEDPPDIGGAKPATTTSQATFDPIGRVLIARDQAQVADSSRGYTAYEYDEAGRPTGIAEAVGTADVLTTLSAYDALDRLTSQLFGAGTAAEQETLTRYDVGGRIYEVDDEFACVRSVYDYRDRPTGVREGLGSGSVPCAGSGTRRITNWYDALGRHTRAEVVEGEGLGDVLVDDTFDAAGNKRTSSAYVAATSTTTTLTSTTNLLDQVIADTRTDGSMAKSTYDPVGNVADSCYWATVPTPAESCKAVGSSFTTAPTRLTSATHDARDNRVQLRDAATNATTIYDPDHNYLVKANYLPTKMTGTNVDIEHQTTFIYDERHRLATVTHQRCTRTTPSLPNDHACTSTAATGSISYAYDLNDNRTQVNEHNGAVSYDRRYCFDAQDRLEYRNTGAACSATVKDEAYEYDASGNRTRTVVGGVTTDSAYDAQGQLCKIGATTCGTPNVTYDSSGRTATWNGWWLTYDAQDRLQTACKSSSCATTADKIEMVYDGEGRRVKLITDPANAPVATTREFRYQGDAIVEEKLDGVTTHRYLVDEAGSVVQVIIPSGVNAGTYVVTWNGHGDAMGLWRIKTDGTLELANSWTYETWGKPLPTTTHANSNNGGTAYGDLGFRFLYVGEFDVQWDAGLGLDLLYMHARHYSPALGRFLQPDPDRSESNLYAYAANNPVTEIDPDGTCFVVCQLVVGAIIDTVVYMATTENANLAGLAGAVAGGAVESAINPLAKLGKVSKLVSAASKIRSKISKASRWTSKARSAGRACARHSFDAATLVSLADGRQVPIEELQVGDEVLAWNESTQSVGAYPITAVWTHDDPVTGWVVIDGEAIATTPGHQFATIGRGWVEAADLKPGDIVRALAGPAGLVQAIEWGRGPDTMYDLTVDAAHTFAVGEGAWVTHNRNCKVKTKSTHGNSHSSDRPTILYKMQDSATGRLLKYGVTSNLKRRYTTSQLSGVTVREMTRGTRRQMAQLERFMVSRYGGPRNREPWSSSRR